MIRKYTLALIAGLFLTLSTSTFAQIVTPTISFIVRTNFPTPVFDDAGILRHYTNATKVVAWWYADYQAVGWDFLYRTNGVWLKPDATFNTREPGTGERQKSILLDYFPDYQDRYLFLPIVTLHPSASR